MATEKDDGWSIRRAGEFLKNILDLETNVSALQKENAFLRDGVSRLQKIVNEHNGQLKVLVAALNSTLESRVTSAAQQAAIDTTVRLLTQRNTTNEDD